MLAQGPGLSALYQAHPGQSAGPTAGLPGPYRFCTPAEYGDPFADCLPTPSSVGYGAYNDVNRWNPLAVQQPGLDWLPGASAFDHTRESAANQQRSLAPAYYEKEPETELQRYVAASTGQVLPIFGASLFERVPATFAPIDRVPVNADYLIAPGDELQITVWGQVNFMRRSIVGRTGEVILPEAGPVVVSGMYYAQAASVFKSALSHYYKNFDLSVTLGQLHSIQIFVVGEARRPGSYTVSSLSTLVNAIFASGGPSARGSMRAIQLRHADRVVCEFDLYDLLVRGDKSKDATLAPGDVILIPPAGARVAVAGSVEHPAVYEMRASTTLGEALTLADGPSPLASGREAVLERVSDQSALQVLRVPLSREGLQTELRNGDIVRLLPVVRRFENTVSLRGNVADPGRFPWHEGMRLSELIPNKDSLLTRDYWRRRNDLVACLETGAEPCGIPSGTDRASSPTAAASEESGSASPSLSAEPRGKAVTVGYQDQRSNAQADRSLGAAIGSDSAPPLRTFLPLNSIQPAAPDINWEYAVIERIDRETLATRILPFSLGKLLNLHDPAQDLLLAPGDVVTIFSKADFSIPRLQQANQVRLEGEIAMAGVYSVLPGETLRALVKRAGGLTQNAYLYGAQFTRESTRREQQRRYDDFLNQFDREVTEAASNLSSRVTSPQQAATAQTSLNSQRDLVERLRKVPMNGRIVLDMAPNSRGEKDLPDLPLENGDRLYVPSRPSTVNVIGTVFNQAAFLHQEDLRAGDYLKKAGGPARSADRTHMFIVRADGSVVSRAAASVFFAKSFDASPLFPGDTLVVPTYINRTTFVRNLMDWSQVFSNLALGAAAVNVLH